MAAELLMALACAPPETDLSFCDTPDLVLNEVYSASVEEGDETDFVEVYNAGDETLDISGWGLSRAEFRTEFTFLGTTLAAGAWLAVPASSYDPGDGTVVTDFDLNRDGAAIFLSEADGDLCDALIYPDQHAWFSYGRRTDGVRGETEAEEAEAWCYQDPSEGADNEPCLEDS